MPPICNSGYLNLSVVVPSKFLVKLAIPGRSLRPPTQARNAKGPIRLLWGQPASFRKLDNRRSRSRDLSQHHGRRPRTRSWPIFDHRIGPIAKLLRQEFIPVYEVGSLWVWHPTRTLLVIFAQGTARSLTVLFIGEESEGWRVRCSLRCVQNTTSVESRLRRLR